MTRITSRIMRSALLVAALVFSLASPALCASIWTPSLGNPVLATPGSDFDILASFDDSDFDISLSIVSVVAPDNSFPITSDSPTATGKAVIKATVPADIAPGLYDLCIDYASTRSGRTCSDHAVAVIKEFKKEFRFAIFSDYHVGDPRGMKSSPGISLEELRAKGLAALNAEAPDFALVTGDLVSYPTGYKREFPTCYKELVAGARVPLFIVPGNHDLYVMGGVIDGRDMWKNTFGPLHMAFNYDGYSFIGITSYNWPRKMRDQFGGNAREEDVSYSGGVMNEREMKWLREKVATAQDAGRKPVIFAHHSPRHMLKRELDEKFKLLTSQQFLAALHEMGIQNYFFGHTHADYERPDGDLNLVSTGSVGSGIEDAWTFRIVDVHEDGTFEMRVVEFWKPQEKK